MTSLPTSYASSLSPFPSPVLAVYYPHFGCLCLHVPLFPPSLPPSLPPSHTQTDTCTNTYAHMHSQTDTPTHTHTHTQISTKYYYFYLWTALSPHRPQTCSKSSISSARSQSPRSPIDPRTPWSSSTLYTLPHQRRFKSFKSPGWTYSRRRSTTLWRSSPSPPPSPVARAGPSPWDPPPPPLPVPRPLPSVPRAHRSTPPSCGSPPGWPPPPHRPRGPSFLHPPRDWLSATSSLARRRWSRCVALWRGCLKIMPT